MQPPPPPAAPNLENCDREPIHIPGSIQPHGALLAFDRLGRLSHASANAAALLGLAPEFGRTLRAGAFDDKALEQHLQDALADADGDELFASSLETRIADTPFDVVLHAQHGRLICEFERRAADAAEVASFAHLAYRAMDTLKRQRSVGRLLDAAVTAVRRMTGFDRVMAYRFGHDDSGDVVAESCSEQLEPYLGRRYPASDIPAQARRLYILNTLRLIADVGYVPVPLLADATQREPLDLSHSVLRSVSPIHVEYLRNMGVGASMSVSIVIGGRLWGMLACHHMAPRQVPYPTRMAVDVMAQVIASTVQSLAAREREGAVARAAWLRTEIVRAVAAGADVGEVVLREAPALCDNLGCDALLVTLDGLPRAAEQVHPAWARALAAWLATRDESLVHVHDGALLPPPVLGQPDDAHWCGLLALRLDAPRQGWIVCLRRELIQTIRWGGKPEKAIAHGPLGPRLTPRGSFAEWRETVRGRAEPWNDVQLEIASQLLDSVGRAYADRVLEIDQLRSQLWAVLGHDLRNPLQSLSMATTALERGGGSPERLNSVIRNSTQRMKQLLGDVLDIARLHHGFDLTMAWKRIDLAALIRQLVEESQVAHPAIALQVDLPPMLMADADEVRFTQVVANLLSNARHHGHGRIAVAAREEDGLAVVRITNDAPPIPGHILATLFDPFKRQSADNQRNRTGMGLGLYIAHQVVRGHHGTLEHIGGDGSVSFEARIPLVRAA